MILENKWIVLEDKVVFGDLILENGRIKELHKKEPRQDLPVEYVMPGFIDLHIHGSNGFDAMDPETDAVEKMALSLVKEGTTAFLPTTMTQTKENIDRALSNIADYVLNQNPNAAVVLGVHLEGPFIHKGAAGAQPLNCIIEANTTLFDHFQKVSGNQIRKVSIAPDIEGAMSLIEHLKETGVVASIAHTKANYDTVVKAIKAGATSLTHTYNAMTPLHHRDVGVVGAALLHDELNAELIYDLIHVSMPAAKILIKAKGVEGVSLITDSMRAKYMTPGIYDLGGQSVHIQNNEARLADGTLAGSILKMNDGVKNLIKTLQLSPSMASVLASLNPAKQLKLDHLMGSIEVGKLANLVILNQDYDVVHTIINGKVVL
ncbi:N-acetylglucosamine-6-phosphate deacetylase [Acholeplasma vituli]|uniref:N-acetylglucosamine-6-phosphate deacetylase n=1 Tax=Paracholeplasma vituli TaxID=69473 RepID=A0ABT2PTJ7_9MOLU|nr:N-acetylglucosamine-6-phosphate deacetylase [Paracholeplasma vituli]MCU0104262.1 N-acetylglucosamine-6-phosphate deacetylase [Paracholeplasma vituli]